MIHYLVLLGVAVNFYGTAVYIRDIIRGQTKPNLVSWVLWAVAPLIASAAAFSSGIRWAVLPTFSVGFGPVLVILTVLLKRNGVWRPTKFDYVCGGSSVIALILWIITKQPYIAIAFSVIGDGLAALPTLKKAWQFPATESGITYVAALFNMLTTIAALQIYNFSELAFPIYNVAINIAISFAIYRRRLFAISNT
ncbi:hypothetical protein D4R52_00495 [bacterium]|nr:MAG: hypothetical protein D4R52_00495 [bacterium]